jgi:hypothetical protein
MMETVVDSVAYDDVDVDDEMLINSEVPSELVVVVAVVVVVVVFVVVVAENYDFDLNFED